MAIDLGNNPSGDPPTTEEKEQLRSALDLGTASTTNAEDYLSKDGGTMNENSTISFYNGSRIAGSNSTLGTDTLLGISQLCSADYEIKWSFGILYVLSQIGEGQYVRSVFFALYPPELYHDSTSGFIVGSKWTLDDGTSYICADNTEDNAIWDLETTGVTNPYNLNELVGTITLDTANGSVQYGYASGNIAIGVPTGVVVECNTTIELIIQWNPGCTLDFSSGIQLASDSAASFPKTLIDNHSYRLKLAYQGAIWCLISLVGGFQTDL